MKPTKTTSKIPNGDDFNCYCSWYPQIYYGSEIGMAGDKGKGDGDIRRDFRVAGMAIPTTLLPKPEEPRSKTNSTISQQNY